ncbi:MAG TPA: phage major capsid protein, P2 family [Herbaspirillum sp.]|nr:phage major capsid protein, P2 family [Herbaspirillum sp.]
MKNDTRKIYEQYSERIAQLNGVPDASKSFSVDPSVQQKLETRIQESSAFLSKINIIGVDEKQGEKLGLSISGPIASRTDTATKDRQTRDLSALDKNNYSCQQTNYDSHIPYARLDAWAKFKDFQNRIRDLIIKRQALDRMMIGFNGISIAADTDIDTNPLLQDVNKGWLQKIREDAPEHFLQEGEKEEDRIIIGTGGDYANLDALVYDLIGMLDPWFRDDTGLVAILGRKMLSDKYFPLINKEQPATEIMATDLIISQKRVGGLSAVTVPYFPEHGILVTRYDNLSVYFQNGARRRYMVENPKRNRVENYESSNDDYVIEDYGLIAAAENIQIGVTLKEGK